MEKTSTLNIFKKQEIAYYSTFIGTEENKPTFQNLKRHEIITEFPQNGTLGLFFESFNSAKASFTTFYISSRI